MKCLKLTSGSRYIFTKDELESLKILMRTIVYSNTNLKIDLKLTETENTIVLHDAGARNEDVIVKVKMILTSDLHLLMLKLMKNFRFLYQTIGTHFSAALF